MRKVAVIGAAAVVGVAALVVSQRMKSSMRWAWVLAIVKEFEMICAAPETKLKQVSDAITLDMHAGLASEGASKLKMVISYVDNLPTGYNSRCDEEGVSYALDLGGTNFRVLRVQLGGKEVGIVHQEFTEALLPLPLMSGTSDALSDYIVEKLAEFVDEEEKMYPQPPRKQRELGFTFSFPVMHTSINSGTLIKWTKGFSIDNMVNNAVGTLAGGRYTNKDIDVAVILGTGSNAAYVERAHAIPKRHGPLPESGEMVTNMELGSFRSSPFPLTQYDYPWDVESLNPGEQIFEKVISCLYLPEVLCRVLLRMAGEASFFGDAIPPKLKIPFILSHASGYNVGSEGCRQETEGYICVLMKMGRGTAPKEGGRKTVIAMDGGLYEHYMEYSKCLENTVRELLGEGVASSIQFEQSSDGPGIGAALLATSNSLYRDEKSS